jgi:hypothetical protein
MAIGKSPKIVHISKRGLGPPDSSWQKGTEILLRKVYAQEKMSEKGT